MKKLKYYIPIIIMLLVAAFISVLSLCGVWDVSDIIQDVKGSKETAFFVIMALFLLKGCSLGIPYGAVLIGCALIYDLKTAVMINILGTVLCISVSYLVGRTSKNLTFEKVIDKYPKFGKYFDNADRYKFATCYVVHSLHLSTEVQGVLFGLLRTPYFAYLAASLIALFPSMMCYTVAGSEWDFGNPLLWIFLGLDVMVIIAGLWTGKKKILSK